MPAALWRLARHALAVRSRRRLALISDLVQVEHVRAVGGATAYAAPPQQHDLLVQHARVARQGVEESF